MITRIYDRMSKSNKNLKPAVKLTAAVANVNVIEPLEGRVLMSASPLYYPQFVLHHGGANNNAITHNSSPAGDGYTPAQIKQAYGISNVKFGSVVGDGTGQTIAIIDAYDDPTALADLKVFDQAFGLPDPVFQKLNQNGGTSLPGTDPSAGFGGGSWELEESLDIEWAHAIAPKAKIILLESNAPDNSLYTAADTARHLPGVTAVSMSFGGVEDPSQTTLDSTFTTPAGHAGVTFFASSGDNGASDNAGNIAPGYPAASPNVVAVGGTSLFLNSGGYGSETAWSGSGGGISGIESLPGYQSGIVKNTGGFRGVPDVAFDADPNTGVPVYDSFDFGANGWIQVGGTSLSSPCWAGLAAIINQGRALNGLSSLDGTTQTLPSLYKLNESTNFHDVTSGNNGHYNAGPGYDLATGLGSPKASSLAAALTGSSSSGPIVVNTTADQVDAPGSSTVSLRDAIAQANASTTPATIQFSPTVFTSAKTITLTLGNLTLTNTGNSITLISPAAGLIISGGNHAYGLVVNGSVTASLSGVQIVNGTSAGILNYGNVSLTNVVLANDAGGGMVNDGTAILNFVTISNNVSNGHNGAGFNNNGTATLNNVMITANSDTNAYGAGVFNSGTLTAVNVTVSGNSLKGYGGGGIYNDHGLVTLTNCTVASNSSTGYGGGVLNYGGTLHLADDTIAYNAGANFGGGLFSAFGGSATVANTIVAGNSCSGLAIGPDVYGGINSSSHNLIGKTDGSSGWVTSDLTGTVTSPLDAKLGTLAYNGGFTKTLLPLAGSPVINKGSNAEIATGLTTDQRGKLRIVGGTVDIGAVEFQNSGTNAVVNVSEKARVNSVASNLTPSVFSDTPFSSDLQNGDLVTLCHLR